MKTVTRTYQVCSVRDLKEMFPERYKREFSDWQSRDLWDWWNSVYDCFAQDPAYYLPAVAALGKADLTLKQNRDAFHALADKYRPAIDMRTPPKVEGFDIGSYRSVDISNFDLYVFPAVETGLLTVPDDMKLAWDIFSHTTDRIHYYISVDPNREECDYLQDSYDVARYYIVNVLGVYYEDVLDDDVESLADKVAALYIHWDAECKDLYEGIQRAVHDSLEKEHEYQISEECFLESCEEFEVEVDSVTIDE